MNSARKWCRQHLQALDPLGVGDVVASFVVLLLTVHWLGLAADMLAASYVVSSGGAYAASALTFLLVGTFVVAPLWQRRTRSVFWLVGKLIALVTSLGLGLYCSIFHGTSFFFFHIGSDMKGHLSFANVFWLRRDAEWMASNHLSGGDRYHERVAYMAILLVLTAVVGVVLVLRSRRNRKASAGVPGN